MPLPGVCVSLCVHCAERQHTATTRAQRSSNFVPGVTVPFFQRLRSVRPSTSRLVVDQVNAPRRDPMFGASELVQATSTASKHYTGLKFGSKKHFYGRVAPEGILTLHIEIDLFTAAERPERILVSKCTFTRHVKTVVSYNVLILCWYCGRESDIPLCGTVAQ